jgi:multidrug resistance efflux pump
MNGLRLSLGGGAIVAVLALAAWMLRPHDATPSLEGRGKREEGRVKTREEGRGKREEKEKTDSNTTTYRAAVDTSALPSSLFPLPSASGERLALTGAVQPDTQATLSSARLPARIVAVYVREGGRVQRGQVVVQLDDAEFRAQTRTAQAGVAAAQTQLHKAQAGREAQRVKANADVTTARAGLRQAQGKVRQAELTRDAAQADHQADLAAARKGVDRAQIALTQAKQTLHGLEELAKVGGVSRSDLEAARTQVSIAQSDLESAQAQVRRLENGPREGVGPYRVALAQKDVEAAAEGVRQAQEAIRTAEEARRQTLVLADQEIRAARAAVTQAQSGVTGALSAQSQTRVIAPIDGIATGVVARAGETAQPGVPLLTVISLAGVHVDALVPARELTRLHVGLPARIAVDTQPGRPLAAHVSEIARIAEPDGRTFRVKFRLQNAAALRPGQTARITIGR